MVRVQEDVNMKSKHTPTPWSQFIYNKKKPHEIVISVPYSDGTDHLCTIDSSARPEENRANAKFIVRACNSHDELLQACKEALIGLHCNGDFSSHRHNIIEQAIIKAEGNEHE